MRLKIENQQKGGSLRLSLRKFDTLDVTVDSRIFRPEGGETCVFLTKKKKKTVTDQFQLYIHNFSTV